mgnify:CR=1 FL=1
MKRKMEMRRRESGRRVEWEENVRGGGNRRGRRKRKGEGKGGGTAIVNLNLAN